MGNGETAMIKALETIANGPVWQLPWHLQDDSWDISLTFLLLPVLIYMFATNVSGWIIALTFLSGLGLGFSPSKW
jgi:hypothetical protein